MRLVSPAGVELTLKDEDPLVYLASPGFTPEQLESIRMFEERLPDLGFNVYSPFRDGIRLTPDASQEDRKRVWLENVWAIEQSRAMVAILDDKDTGTTVEFGYAACKKIPIVAVAYRSQKMNVMLAEAVVGFAGEDGTFDQIMVELRHVLTKLSAVDRHVFLKQMALGYHYEGEIQ